jgi:hypothetical protein
MIRDSLPDATALPRDLPIPLGLGPAVVEVSRWLAIWTAGLLMSAAAAIWWRRLSGAVEMPLDWRMLLAAAALVAATAGAARASWTRWTRGQLAPRRLRWFDGLVSLGVLAAGGALSLPGSPPAGLVLLWALLIVEESWAWVPVRKWFRGRVVPAPGTPETQPGEDPADPRAVPSGDVIQQFTRRRAADGTEMLSGWLRVALCAGQRTASIHLSFCPPLDRAPQLVVHQREGPPARVKASQVLPYGARLDLKLVEAAEAAGYVLLEFSTHPQP